MTEMAVLALGPNMRPKNSAARREEEKDRLSTGGLAHGLRTDQLNGIDNSPTRRSLPISTSFGIAAKNAMLTRKSVYRENASRGGKHRGEDVSTLNTTNEIFRRQPSDDVQLIETRIRASGAALLTVLMGFLISERA